MESKQKKTTGVDWSISVILGLLPLFLPSLSCLPLLYSSCGDISPPSLLLSLFLLSLYLSVLLLPVQPDRTLIDSVDATQFCTVQCTAILLQCTPVSWHIHKTPLCAEWNVPEGGGLYWKRLVMWSGSYYLCCIVGEVITLMKNDLFETTISQGYIVTLYVLMMKSLIMIFIYLFSLWLIAILLSYLAHCSVTMGTAAVSASLPCSGTILTQWSLPA